MASSAPRPTPTDFNGIRDQIVELFCQGKSKSLICTALGLERKEVDRIINQEFNTRLGNRQQLIERTALELEWLKSKMMDRVEGNGWDRRDVETALKVIESKRKLFGLDAPVKVEVNHIDEMSDEDIKLQLKDYEKLTSQLALPEPVEEAEFEEKVKLPDRQQETANLPKEGLG